MNTTDLLTKVQIPITYERYVNMRATLFSSGFEIDEIMQIMSKYRIINKKEKRE